MSRPEQTDLGALRPVVRESWLRCRASGLKPGISSAPMVLSEDSVAQLQAESPLVQVASPIVNFTFDAIRDIPSALLVVSDPTGRILYHRGSSNAQDAAERINAISGACWSEELMGTDSLACCLHLRRPVSITWHEHYLSIGHTWTGQSAPVMDLFTNRLTGAICLYGYEQEAHAKAQDLVSKCADLTERGLYAKGAAARLLLYENYASARDRYKSDPCLAITNDGLLLTASTEASRLLGIPAGAPHSVSTLSEMGLIAPETELSRSTETISLRGRGGTIANARLSPVMDGVGIAGFIAVIDHAGHHAPRSSPWNARYTFADIVGFTPKFAACVKRAGRIAETGDPVLITGESGTGKELFAQSIHNASARRSSPFMPVNCGGMSDELLGAELFGYVEGAFTGATRRGRLGKFRSAHGGTLFLDEVEAMSPRMQSHLLRVLEEKRVFPVGSEEPYEADVRILAATNVDLMGRIKDGSFRKDLYYRLSGQMLEIPPLRERRSDISVFVATFLAGTGIDLAPSALRQLESYCWPGNVRELRNVLTHAQQTRSGSTITAADLPAYVCSAACTSCEFGRPARQESCATGTVLQESERAAILHALRNSGGNRSRAAVALGLSRVTLYRKLKKHHIQSDYS
ncbi:MAG: sigma-54-dependent Fis family transcriptional regulator [Armatimonadota bacterium]|nr:sigma-54-dependent Fis family transcriptional regulator [Armatimonadota bacterium]